MVLGEKKEEAKRELESGLQDKVDNLLVQIEIRSQQPMSVVLGLDNTPQKMGDQKEEGRNRRQKN